MRKFLAWLKSLFTVPPLPPPVIVHPEPSPVPEGSTLSLRAYALAKGELGVEEDSSYRSNKRIIEYHQATDLKATDDSVPWCSSFMNWCIQNAGGNGTKDAMARSWLGWGKKITEPQEGDTVIFSSPLRGSEAGHVAFFIEKLSPGFISVLGGNQSDSVSIEQYPTAHILGYRRSLDG